MSLPDAYRRLVRIPEKHVEILPTEGEIDISSLRKGVLFILARWSGASQSSFRMLNEVLREIPGSSTLRLWIADTDHEATQRFMQQVGDVPTGCGETYWIKDGRIIEKVRSCRDIDKTLIEEQVHRLVGEKGIGEKGT